MSGIAVIYNLDRQPVERSMMLAMKNRLNHRGRDGSGVWVQDCIGLLHLMNWTTPQSVGERLPAQSRRSPSFITCDARIDNRSDLIPQLPFEGRKADEVTDSEIILAAYEKWGKDCLPHLIGDFIFAIWDDREKELFCARDPLGVKHFYYYFQPGKFFALASEIKALLALENVPCELNEEHLGDYLVLNPEDKEETFYKNIKRLPATHALTISRNGLRTWCYWQPDGKEIRLKKDAEYQEAFREKFTEAVICRLRSAYPVGSMLSGGLDSSSIVCVASQHLGKRQIQLQTFSAVFPTVAKLDQRIDETKFIHSVVKHTGCQAHFVNADDASPLNDMDKLLWHTDHPVGAPNVYMDWELYKAANKEGVRILLSGTDGDSTVSHGYEDFEHFARRGWFLRLFKEAIALSKNMPRRSHGFKRLVWHRGFAKAMPDSLVNLWRVVWRRKAADYERSPISFPLHFNTVNESFREKYDLESRIVNTQMSGNASNADSSVLQHWNGLTSGHFSMMLEQLEKASAAFGVEPRYPFFDRRLIEFCIALPPGQRIYKGWTRSIFRHSMDGILPSDVQWRTDKSNIGASVKVNLLKYGYTQLEDAIRRNSWKLEKYINPEMLKAAYRDYQLDPMGKESEALLILTNVYLLNWLEHTGFSENRLLHRPTFQPRSVAA